MINRRSGLVAVIAGLCLAVGLWIVLTGKPPPTGGDGVIAAEAPKAALRPSGFTAAFDAELKKIGQITPKQFAERYPAPKYLEKVSWDPTTAKFFDKVNVEKVKKPA